MGSKCFFTQNYFLFIIMLHHFLILFSCTFNIPLKKTKKQQPLFCFILSLSAAHQPPATMLITPVPFLCYSPLYFCHRDCCACFCYIAAICLGLQQLLKWGGGGHFCPIHNKWFFSVIWLAQIRGFIVVVRRQLSKMIRWLQCCCLSKTLCYLSILF